jgi:hypothetical protein
MGNLPLQNFVKHASWVEGRHCAWLMHQFRHGCLFGSHFLVSQNDQLSLVGFFSDILGFIRPSKVDHAASCFKLLDSLIIQFHINDRIFQVIILDNSTHCTTIYFGEKIFFLIDKAGSGTQYSHLNLITRFSVSKRASSLGNLYRCKSV